MWAAKFLGYVIFSQNELAKYLRTFVLFVSDQKKKGNTLKREGFLRLRLGLNTRNKLEGTRFFFFWSLSGERVRNSIAATIIYFRDKKLILCLLLQIPLLWLTHSESHRTLVRSISIIAGDWYNLECIRKRI